MSGEDEKHPQSFLSAIKGFNKTSLKQTDTKVLTVTGEVLVEKKKADGGFTSEKASNPNTYGFVPWGEPDLQVGEILPDLIMGSQDVALELPVLEKYKVSHILNLATFIKPHFPDKFSYMSVKIMDVPESRIINHFESCFKFIDTGRQEGSCVLVHCNAGVSRSATIVIGYLMSREKMSLDKAYAHVKCQRPATRPNDGFRQQLQEYQEILRKT